jgi:hypothetical protein
MVQAQEAVLQTVLAPDELGLSNGMIYRCRVFKFQQRNTVSDRLSELLNNHPVLMARPITFHKPLNADIHKYALGQPFRYGGPCAWWGRH